MEIQEKNQLIEQYQADKAENRQEHDINQLIEEFDQKFIEKEQQVENMT